MTAPRLTDRAALSRARARARRRGLLDPFVHSAARDDIEERLLGVNRPFTKPAIVTGLPELWQGLAPASACVPDDEILALEPGAHDLVVHALTLHWADDPVGQLIQCRRALRPDGLFLCVTFGGQTLHEVRSVMAETEARLRGGISPRVVPMGEIRDLGALLQRAEFALPVADSRTLSATFGDFDRLVAELRDMGETNALDARERRALSRAECALARELYARHFPADGDRIAATFELVFLTGWAPADSQPKPLRPGSAASRLAEALGTEERPAGDRPPGVSD